MRAGGPDDGPHIRRDNAEREAAQLRYELGRLRDRRPVRVALALSGWRRGGRDAALRTFRGDPPRWDVPGPASPAPRPRYPHLRAVSLGVDPFLGGVVPATRITPEDRIALDRDRPDLLVVDDLTGWQRPALDDLLDHARRTGVAVVAVGPDAVAACGPAATVRVGSPGTGVDIEVVAAIDLRRDHPVGRDPEIVAITDEDAPPGSLLTGGARSQVPIAADTPERRAALGDTLADQLLVRAAAASGDAVSARAAQLRADGDQLDRLAVQLRRHVLGRYGRPAIVDALVTRLELDVPPRRRIGLLLATRRPELVPALTEDLAAQSWDEGVELVVAVHGDAALPDRLAVPPSAVLRVGADRPLGAVLNAALDATTGPPLLAKVDDDDRYGRHHLADLALALDYSGADAVGKRRHAIHDVSAGTITVPAGPREERFEDHLPGATMLVHGDVLRALRWRHVPNGVDTELVRAIHLAGGACYSTHRFGFVRTRHGDHTYTATARTFAGAALNQDLRAYLDT